MTCPPLSELVRRPTAMDVRLQPGAPIWYRQIQTGGYGFARTVPGVFERYGNVRVAVVLQDVIGGEHRVYVSGLNVYARTEVE